MIDSDAKLHLENLRTAIELNRHTANMNERDKEIDRLKAEVERLKNKCAKLREESALNTVPHRTTSATIAPVK